MFCQNCGAQVPDGNAFCPYCGTSTGQPRQQPWPQPPKKNNTLFIALVALVAVLLITTVVLVFVLVSRDSGSSDSDRDDSRTEEKDTGKDKDTGDDQDADDPGSGASDAGSVAEAMAVSWFTADVDAMLDLLPDELIEVMEKSGIDLNGDFLESEKDLRDLFRRTCRELNQDFLGGITLSKSDIKFGNLEEDRNKTEDLKDDVIDLYADEYDITVKDFAVYVGTLTATVDGERGSVDLYVPAIKIGSRWYVDLFNLNDLLWEPFI